MEIAKKTGILDENFEENYDNGMIRSGEEYETYRNYDKIKMIYDARIDTKFNLTYNITRDKTKKVCLVGDDVDDAEALKYATVRFSSKYSCDVIRGSSDIY